MLEQLRIENFRCFKSFELEHFGRVNLLVGENNSGKTSILEAIKLFCSRGDFETIYQLATNRGEYFQHTEEIDLSHLFYKHKTATNHKIKISGINNREKKQLLIAILYNDDSLKDEIKQEIFWISEKNLKEQYKYLNYLKQKSIESDPNFLHRINSYTLFLTREQYNMGYYDDYDTVYGSPIIRFMVTGDSTIIKTIFRTSSLLSSQKSLYLFNQIVLTPEEDLVYQALQIIEPNIERIAPIGNDIKNNNSRSGFFVRLKDTQKRIPIGSMGDGIWRMLGLSLALVSAKDGVLLVDEIDTGLHYTALEDMWKLIWETSKKLNVQVFATTHSSDCWKALEALTSREDVGEEDISIQRIEKDAPRSVAYNKEEIATAVEREIEVR